MWLIVIRGDRTQSRYSGTNVVSIRRPTISEIPWKSFCTSMPVIALVLSNMCYASSFLLNGSYYDSYDINVRIFVIFMYTLRCNFISNLTKTSYYILLTQIFVKIDEILSVLE